MPTHDQNEVAAYRLLLVLLGAIGAVVVIGLIAAAVWWLA